MCDLAGFFTCFENSTVSYILCDKHIFWGVTQNIQARSFMWEIAF